MFLPKSHFLFRIYIYVYTHTHTHTLAEEPGTILDKTNILNHIFLNATSFYLLFLWMSFVLVILFKMSLYLHKGEGISYRWQFTKAKEHSLPYYSLIALRRADRFMPFLRALAYSETKTFSSRIWILLSESIFFNNNCYTFTLFIYLFFY